MRAIRFRMPPTVRVKGVMYDVKIVTNLKNDETDEMCSGLHDCENKVISVDSEQKGRAQRQTFFHEYFHAYLFECNIREGLSSELEEVIVETLSQSLEDNDLDVRWRPKC